MFCWNSSEIYKEKESLEDITVVTDVRLRGVSGHVYSADVAPIDKKLVIIEKYDRIWEEDVERLLCMACDTKLDGIMFAPFGCYSPEALSMINRYTPKIQLKRTGVEGKSC